MPTFWVDGRPHQINYSDVFRTDWRRAQTIMGHDGLKLVKAKHNAAAYPDTTHISSNIGPPSWTVVEDKVLQKLVACHLSWNWISVAMGNRPISELKRHWQLIQRYGISRGTETKVVSSSKWASVTPSPGIQGNGQDKHPRPLQIQAVHYLNEEWSFEDIILLHKIAANWERERWLTITNRFSGETGRSITPEQAKSIIEF